MKYRVVTVLAALAGTALWSAVPAGAEEAKMGIQMEESAQAVRDAGEDQGTFLPGWLIDLSAGYSMSQGNSDTQNLLARAAVMKKFDDDWELLGKGEYAWGKFKERETGEYEKTADRGLAAGQANLFVIENGYVYGRSEISYDKLKDIDRRLDNGGGVGYNVWRRNEDFASVETGACYIDTEYSDGGRDHGLYLRLAQNGALQINERVTFLESFEYKPKLEDFSDYLLTAEAALRVSLMGNIYLQLTVTDRYDNSAPAGIERNDLSLITSLGASF